MPNGYTFEGILKYSDSMKLFGLVYLVIFFIIFIAFLHNAFNIEDIKDIDVTFICLGICITMLFSKPLIDDKIGLKQYDLAYFTVLENKLEIKANVYDIDKEINMQDYTLKVINRDILFKSKDGYEKNLVITLISQVEANSVYYNLNKFFDDYN